MIGDKYILWITKRQLDAYKDQFDIPHSAYVVLEEFHVSVIEEKQVPGMFGNGTFTGIKAKAKDSEHIFTRHWNSFPDDSSSPNYYWDVMEHKGELIQPVDAMLATELFLHVNERGERKIPTGVSFCDEHKVYFQQSCWRCEVKKQRQEARLSNG